MENNRKILHSSPTIGQDDINAVVKVLQSGHLEEGIYVRQFEAAVAQVTGRKFAIATINGFSAIHLSLIGLGICKGDEVILPAYSCPAILNPILLMEAVPVFADIEQNSFNIGPSTILPLITSKTKAIILPHTFGFPAPVRQLTGLDIPVIEDCAQSLGGWLAGKPLGSFTKVSVTSFYATKMTAAGDAGMVLTDDEDLAEKVRDHVYYGHKKHHLPLAYNYHLSNMPAALGLSQINKLAAFTSARKKLALVYDSFFQGSSLKIDFSGKSDAVYWRYPVLCQGKRDRLKARLAENNIFTGFGVLEGLHLIRDQGAGPLPNTGFYLDHILSLPLYPSLSEEDVTYIAKNVLTVLSDI